MFVSTICDISRRLRGSHCTRSSFDAVAAGWQQARQPSLQPLLNGFPQGMSAAAAADKVAQPSARCSSFIGYRHPPHLYQLSKGKALLHSFQLQGRSDETIRNLLVFIELLDYSCSSSTISKICCSCRDGGSRKHRRDAPPQTQSQDTAEKSYGCSFIIRVAHDLSCEHVPPLLTAILYAAWQQRERCRLCWFCFASSLARADRVPPNHQMWRQEETDCFRFRWLS